MVRINQLSLSHGFLLRLCPQLSCLTSCYKAHKALACASLGGVGAVIAVSMAQDFNGDEKALAAGKALPANELDEV